MIGNRVNLMVVAPSLRDMDLAYFEKKYHYATVCEMTLHSVNKDIDLILKDPCPHELFVQVKNSLNYLFNLCMMISSQMETGVK